MIIFIVKITQHKRGGKLNISSIIRICNFHTVDEKIIPENRRITIKNHLNFI